MFHIFQVRQSFELGGQVVLKRTHVKRLVDLLVATDAHDCRESRTKEKVRMSRGENSTRMSTTLLVSCWLVGSQLLDSCWLVGSQLLVGCWIVVGQFQGP